MITVRTVGGHSFPIHDFSPGVKPYRGVSFTKHNNSDTEKESEVEGAPKYRS